MAKDNSVDTIDMFDDVTVVLADKWYIVRPQGVESGPYDTYRMAKNNCKVCHSDPMYGEQILDLKEEFGEDWAGW